jgi:uncharacterized protein (TIGR03118 family)
MCDPKQRSIRRTRSNILASLAATCSLVGFAGNALASEAFQETNLVTDDQAFLTGLGYAPAANVDPALVNPWGVSYGPGSPFWVSDNNSGVSTLYSGTGAKIPLTVTIAPPNGAPAGTSATPTGQVFNATAGDFDVLAGQASSKVAFIFATEDGTISAWNPGVNLNASVLKVDNSASGAVYKGLALGSTGSGNFLYAANFNSGKVDVFDKNFSPIGGFSFTDPSPPPVPAGTPAGQNWAPFNVQTLNGHLFVTYALQNAAKHDDVAGTGNGFVDEFNLDGTFVKRITTGGVLDSPWALDIAPAGFGQFANDLLVGNFGDGTIDAFNLVTDAFVGSLLDVNGHPIVLGDLWALINGGGGSGGDPNSVYFTAGVQDEAHGLFGQLTFVPEPGSLALYAAGFAGLLWFGRRDRFGPGGAVRA